MCIAFGIGFTIPVLLVFLELLGRAALRRRCCAPGVTRSVGTFVVAAAITPSGDPISLLALSVPMIVLYFLAILIGWIVAAPPPQARAQILTSSRSACETECVRPDRETILARYDFPLDRFQLAGRRRPRRRRQRRRRGADRERQDRRRRVRDRGRARRTAGAPSTPLRSRRCRTRSTATWSTIHGDDRVGLLTGDNAINGDAPVVVMTTEVLRNMIYARRELGDLEVVVLDEVHFLQDTYRGPVWEEVIIHLPMHVRLVCLSATVSNAAELAEWIETVRGATEVVVEERRPVQLDNFYYVDRPHQRPPTDAADDRRRASQPRRAAPRRQRRAIPAWPPRRSRGRGGAASASWRPRAGSRPSRSSPNASCCRRSTSSSAAPSAKRRRGPVSTPGCGSPIDEERSRINEIANRPAGGSVDRRPRGARARPLHGSADGRLRPAPRGDGAAVQGGRRGVLHRGVGEGRVRHRDARGGHQHAGAQRGDREAHQVHRRPSRDALARPVHPADRPRRAARHRRPRRGGRAVEPVRHVRPGGRAGARASRSTSARRSGRRSTWPPTWCARTTRPPPASC